MRRRTRLAALVGVLLLALTACGLTAQGSPQRVDTGTIAENGPLPSVRRVGVVEIYLLRDERLVSVVRSGRTGQDALSLLAAGPTPVEAAAGIGNALPPQPLRFVGEQEDGTAVVALPRRSPRCRAGASCSRWPSWWGP